MYFLNCAVNALNKKPIILIIYNKSTFLANNGYYQAWLQKKNAFLRLQKKEKSIMVSDFLLSWKHINLFHLLLHEREILITSDIPKKTAQIFEYGQKDSY